MPGDDVRSGFLGVRAVQRVWWVPTTPWAVRFPWVPPAEWFLGWVKAGTGSSSCIFHRVPYEGQLQPEQSLFTSSPNPLTPSQSGSNQSLGFSWAPSRDAHVPGWGGSLGKRVMKGYGWEKPLLGQKPGLSTLLELTWGGSAGEESSHAASSCLTQLLLPPEAAQDGGEQGVGRPRGHSMTPAQLPPIIPPSRAGVAVDAILGAQDSPLPSHSTHRSVHRGSKGSRIRDPRTQGCWRR